MTKNMFAPVPIHMIYSFSLMLVCQFFPPVYHNDATYIQQVWKLFDETLIIQHTLDYFVGFLILQFLYMSLCLF